MSNIFHSDIRQTEVTSKSVSRWPTCIMRNTRRRVKQPAANHTQVHIATVA